MNFLKPAALLALVALLGYTGYTLIQQRNGVAGEIASLAEVAKKLGDENAKLKRDIEYYKRPENLLKASKAQFNYREAGEQMIIVVPDTASASVSGTKK